LTTRAKASILIEMKSVKELLTKLLAPRILVPIIAVVAIIGVIAGVYFYTQYQRAQKLLRNPAQANLQEVQAIINKVGILIELPKNETPRVATVTDITKLKSQPFFVRAVNGDKVLIYSIAKKAIIYRPTTNKIIDVGNLNISENANTNPTSSPKLTTTPTPTVAAKVKVALYNGTKTTGLAKTVETEIITNNQNIEVVTKDNAKNDYKKTIVIDLTGKNKDVAAKLAMQYKGEVETMPSGETTPTGADILIILGGE
jgi:hypothetical protein